MNKKFEWIPFYSELSEKLLRFKQDRRTLVAWIYSELTKVRDNDNRSNIDYIHRQDGTHVKDIDPFSVMAIFNRGLRDEKRIQYLSLFKEFLGIEASVPTTFYGIPIVNNQRAFFFDWNDEGGKKTENLWELFAKVVNGEDVAECFDKAIEDGIPKNSLTMVLFWMAPDRFLGLDSNNRAFLHTVGFPEDYPNLNYSMYIELMRNVRQKMMDKTIPYESFAEISNAAWELSRAGRIWMFKGDKSSFSQTTLNMGSSAQGKLNFTLFDSKEELKKAYQKAVGKTDHSIPNMYWGFMNEVEVGDIVVVFGTEKKQKKQYHWLYGWGRITSEWTINPSLENPIQRDVEWHRPFPDKAIKETSTKNALYFHKVSGAKAKNIMKLLNIIENEDIDPMEKNKYQDYIDLLEANKNLILTGAPGTGKTYMAKEIARLMNPQSEPGFVQFHPSYDYTDFVEGLRPKEREDGFEQRDGVFKTFCKKALFSAEKETIHELNEAPTVWKVSLQGTGDNPVRTDCLQNGYIRIGWSSYGDVEDFDEYDNFNDGGRVVLRAFQHQMKIGDIVVSCYSAKESDAIGVVTGGYEYKKEGGLYPRYRAVKWLVKNIREDIVSINDGKPFTLSSVYRSNITVEDALKLVHKYKPQMAMTESKKQKFVFIIDEINRGEISKIFGELFFSIDPGYRGKEKGLVQTQYQNLIKEGDVFKKGFFVPENVYIIGTMNDIDRSVESMDFAMRRRFAWKEVTADMSMEMLDELPKAEDLKERMRSLNKAILGIRGLGKDYQIGAAYFRNIKNYDYDFDKLWDYHLEGLLREYLRGNNNVEEIMKQLKAAYRNEPSNTNSGQ